MIHRNLEKTLIVSGFLALAALQMSCGRQGAAPKPDATPPSVQAESPVNGTKNVDVDTSIVVTFSEAMNKGSITATTFQVIDDHAAAVDGDITMTSSSVAKFKPKPTLGYSTTYFVTITAGVQDASGNAMAAPYTFVFTTGTQSDMTPPYVVTTNPTGSSVGINAIIGVTFSETMKESTITSSTFAVSDGSRNVPGTITSYDKNTFMFSANDPLNYSTKYTVTIDGSVMDLTGKQLADAAGNHLTAFAWSFRTQDPGPDATPPVVFATVPTTTMPAAVNVSISTPIVASFSERMLAGSLSATTFLLKEQQSGALISGTVSMFNAATAVFTPSYPLKYETHYLAILAAGTGQVTDLAGNPVSANSAAGYSWAFQTEKTPTYMLTVTKSGNGSGDVTASPGALLWSGSTGTANYDLNTLVTLTAAASAGSRFGSWMGCDGTSGAQCTVSMTGPRNVTASFQ